MTNQIKPRYRLGTQNMLDLAKDDATKIPKRTLFIVTVGGRFPAGSVVVRTPHSVERGQDDSFSVCFRAVADLDVDDDNFHYRRVDELQPLI